jgi:hypothetical protein
VAGGELVGAGLDVAGGELAGAAPPPDEVTFVTGGRCRVGRLAGVDTLGIALVGLGCRCSVVIEGAAAPPAVPFPIANASAKAPARSSTSNPARADWGSVSDTTCGESSIRAPSNG